MDTPRFAFAALISALAAAPAFSQTAAMIPIPMAPAAAGQCVIGSDGCGLAGGSAMDPVAEGALVSLGQRVALAPERQAEKKAPLIAAGNSDDLDAPESAADLAAIGGEIINPLAGAATTRGAAGLRLGAAAPARPATFDTRVDDSEIATAQVPKATGLSYVQSRKVEATLGDKGTAFNGDPKLSAGDADFGSGGFGASSNGSR